MATKPKTAPEKRIRVTTDPATRVAAAGVFWAGISEVPAASITPAQLLELKAEPLLKVEEVDVQVDVPEA
jgi:hypothetical protein